MFNNAPRTRDGSPAPAPSAPPPPPASSGKRGGGGAFSVIGPDLVITGNVAATADLHIDGRVDGDVTCGNLIQGGESRIQGSVVAESARLAGMIDGSVSIRQLTIERTARITGDVEYEALSIDSGASVDGRLKHLSTGAPSRQTRSSGSGTAGVVAPQPATTAAPAAIAPAPIQQPAEPVT